MEKMDGYIFDVISDAVLPIKSYGTLLLNFEMVWSLSV